LALWYVGAATIALAGLVAWRIGAVRWAALLVFVAVPAIVAVGSSVLVRLGRQGPPPRQDVPDDERVRVVWLVGDVLPVALAVVAGAGLVRSVAGVVVLDPGVVMGWLALVAGVVLALAAWPVYDRLLDRLDRVSDGRTTKS